MEFDEILKEKTAMIMQVLGGLIGVLIFGFFYFPLIAIYHIGKGIADIWMEMIRESVNGGK